MRAPPREIISPTSYLEENYLIVYIVLTVKEYTNYVGITYTTLISVDSKVMILETEK